MEKSIVLESARGVRNGKVQLTFSQIVKTGTSSTNVLGVLNASDDRFGSQKPRYAWVTGQKSDIEKQFGISLEGLAEGDTLEIGQVDPRLSSAPDVALNIQINETTEGSEYDVANFETRAKRAGKDGDFIMADGMYIYVNSTVVAGEAQHKVYTETTRKAPSAGAAIADALKG